MYIKRSLSVYVIYTEIVKLIENMSLTGSENERNEALTARIGI